MKKPIIGIACCSRFKDNKNIFDDRYYILNNYIDPIVKNGGIPIGILYNDEKIIYKSLEICDGFLVPGGSKIIKSHLKIIDYAITSNKPLLGICMGMQALSLYSLCGKNGLKKENKNVLLIKNNQFHNMKSPPRNKKDIKAHPITIKKESLLFDILKKKKIDVNSYHKYKISNIGADYIVSAFSKDNIIEAIEHKDKSKFVLGVEFHPELLPKMNDLFEEFIKNARK